MSDGQTGIGAKPAVEAVGEIEEIGIGMLGYAFMGKAHSNAFRKIAYMTWPPPLMPRLVAIAGRDGEAVAAAAQRYGYERSTTDWRDIVSDPTIGLFDNGGPNSLHAEPTIAAAEAGKHVLCEKPLGRDADESYDIWQRVEATGVKHLCAFLTAAKYQDRFSSVISRTNTVASLQASALGYPSAFSPARDISEGTGLGSTRRDAAIVTLQVPCIHQTGRRQRARKAA